MNSTIVSQLRNGISIFAIFIVLFISLPVMGQSQFSYARIVERGVISCFDEGLQTSNGDMLFCETSAVAYVGRDLILANDKPIPGTYRSPVFAIWYRDLYQQLSTVPIWSFNTSVLVNARKYEGLTITPDSNYVVATTAFDRKKEDSTKWDNYNTLMMWPVDNPYAAKIVSPSLSNGIVTSVTLRKKFSNALKTLAFPDGVPYFKIEGLAAVPGNKLLFGIREMGKSYKEFDYVMKIVSVSYKIQDSRMVLGEDFSLTYAHNPADTPGIKHTVGISGLEYDKYSNRLYLLTSFESKIAQFRQ